MNGGTTPALSINLNVRVNRTMMDYIDKLAISKFKGRRSMAVRWIIEQYIEKEVGNIE